MKLFVYNCDHFVSASLCPLYHPHDEYGEHQKSHVNIRPVKAAATHVFTIIILINSLKLRCYGHHFANIFTSTVLYANCFICI